jgi:hypothetical protein
MYLMYVDESGDSGLTNSPTTHFALTGMVVHESQWRNLTDRLTAFRKTMRSLHGLPLRQEIHASQMIRSPPVPGMQRHVRLAILRNHLDEIAKQKYVSITNIVVAKANKPAGYDVFDNAWQALFQRFENTIKYGNFPGGFRRDFGLVVTDATNGKKLQKLMRRMSVYNPIPNQAWAGSGYRNLPLLRMIEDPYPKDSRESYLIQAVDTAAFFLLQKYHCNSFIKKKSAQNYISRLLPVLNTRASTNNPLGVVVL